MKAEHDRYLPGDPSRRLITAVRRTLKGYGMRPHNLTLWRDTWSWALKIRNSYWHPSWPSSNEIAAQYVTLLLADMKATPGFRLPFRATEQQTDAVRARLAAAETRALPGIASTAEPKLLPPAEPPAA